MNKSGVISIESVMISRSVFDRFVGNILVCRVKEISINLNFLVCVSVKVKSYWLCFFSLKVWFRIKRIIILIVMIESVSLRIFRGF